MAYEWIGAAAAAAASGASALAMSAKKRGSTRMMQVSKELANYNNELSLKNWRLQNEYDSPVAQMQRYKEAGLNPNLIYGQMSSGSAPEAGQVSTNPEDYMAGSDRYAQALQGVAGAIGMYQDLKAKQGQIDQSRAVTEQVQSQKLLNLLTADKINTQNEFDKAAFDYKLEGLAQDNAKKIRVNSIGEIVDLQKSLNDLEIQKYKIENSKMDKDVKFKQLQKIDAQIDSIYENLSLAHERNRLAERGLAAQFGSLQLGRDELSFEKEKYLSDYQLRQDAQTLNERKFKHEVRKATIDTFNKLDDPGNGLFGIPKLVHNMFNGKKRRTRNINAVEEWYNR